MDIKQSNIPQKIILKDVKLGNFNDIQRMLVEFEYSLLQLKVDGRKEDEQTLKIIAIDKILKLHFPESYVAFFSSRKEILTETEKKIFYKWLVNNNYDLQQEEFLVKNSFKENTKYIYNILSDKYFLLLSDNTNDSLILYFIRKILSEKD